MSVSLLCGMLQPARFAICAMLCGCSIAANAQTVADYCKQQHVNDSVAQLLCVREFSGTHSEPPKEAPRAAPQQPPMLVSPLSNLQIIFGFYDRRFPGFNNGKEHLGVDFSAAAGTTVYAVCDGVVVSNNTDYADIVSAVVAVEHECDQPLGKVYGYYGHVLSPLLANEAVSAGSIIGVVRNWSWNSHLHFGMSTQLLMESWGVVPRGPSLGSLEEQGWLNPLSYFAATATAARPIRPQLRPAPVRRLPLVSKRSIPLHGKPAANAGKAATAANAANAAKAGSKLIGKPKKSK